MSSVEFSEWIAYNERYPLDETDRLEFMLAQITSTIYSVNRTKKMRKLELKDFLPEWQRRRKLERSPKQLWAAIKSSMQQMAGAPRKD